LLLLAMLRAFATGIGVTSKGLLLPMLVVLDFLTPPTGCSSNDEDVQTA
jgi:hypothetical protein